MLQFLSFELFFPVSTFSQGSFQPAEKAEQY